MWVAPSSRCATYSAVMNRRSFVLSTAAAATAAAAPRQLKAVVIGDTGHGDYGHGIDTVWQAFDHVDVVAVADPDADGRERARKRLGAERGYADYRRMLDREKPDLVSVCPRWMDQRAEMLTAAADAGCHIYSEKAFASTLEEADQIVEAVRRNGVKLQLAHQMRRSPYMLEVKRLVDAGELGDIQEVRTRGKEDRRAGGEDLMVLGSHLCDVLRILLGDPRSVFAHVTDSGAELGSRHVREGTEPIGPIAGREIAAMFSFDGGVHGYFGSKQNSEAHLDTEVARRNVGVRFGTTIYGSRGVIYLPNAVYPHGAESYILRSPTWVPGKDAQWEPIPVEHDRRFAEQRAMTANVRMVEDLLEAIAEDREPACSERAGRWTTEMITGIYRSQIDGKPVPLPQAQRRSHPLDGLR